MRLYKLTYKTPDGSAKQAQKWRLDFTDHLQRRQRIPLGVTNRKAAEAIARNIERLISCILSRSPMGEELIRWFEGIPTALKTRLMKVGLLTSQQAEGGRPLLHHLEDFRSGLLAEGVTPQHADLKHYRVKEVIEGCRFVTYSDITASVVQQCVSGLTSVSPTTQNYYLAAVKQFCRWMVRDGRAQQSPVQHLKTRRVGKHEKQLRRALSAEEVGDLLDAALNAEPRYNMTGPQRALLYRLAIETGLRAGEIRSLEVASFDLDAKTVTVKEGDTSPDIS